jgi:hypothetical protein
VLWIHDFISFSTQGRESFTINLCTFLRVQVLLLVVVSLKFTSTLNWLSPFVICSFLRSSQFVWASVAFHQLSFTKSTFTHFTSLTNLGCACPFILTVEGILYTWSNKWCDLYPANQRWAMEQWVGVARLVPALTFRLFKALSHLSSRFTVQSINVKICSQLKILIKIS